MAWIRGGRTLYGISVGIVMLDTQFPRLLGDVGNAGTWGFPVSYRVVSGALPERLAQPDPDPALLAPFLDAVRQLDAEGVRAVITSCGFLAAFQPELAAAASVPVLASPLLQVPLAAQLAGPHRRVAILTARAVLTERHFRGTGWSAADVPVVQVAPPPESHFVQTFVRNTPGADPARLEREVADLAEQLGRDHPDVGAVVAECANFSPFTQVVRDVTGLAVFDLYTLGNLAHLVGTGTSFPRSG